MSAKQVFADCPRLVFQPGQEAHSVAGYSGIVSRDALIPGPPLIYVVWERLAGEIAECFEDPSARHGIKPWIGCQPHQLWNSFA